MSYTDRQIVKSYSGLLEGLNSSSKRELIETLTRSLETEDSKKDAIFFSSFGAFASGKSPEEISLEIKKNRSFTKKDLQF